MAQAKYSETVVRLENKIESMQEKIESMSKLVEEQAKLINTLMKNKVRLILVLFDFDIVCHIYL